MTTHPFPHATLPQFGGVAERRALCAGLAFLELTDSGELDVCALKRWYDEQVVPLGVMPRATIAIEHPVGSVVLDTGPGSGRRVNADINRLAATARLRVVDALRGFIGSPSDDRFLRAAIFLGRVRRVEGRWIARPEPTAPLSAVVLSLFSVGILADRAIFDRLMCVCDTCGRVSFDATSGMRRACGIHGPKPTSGVNAKVTEPAMAAVPSSRAARRVGR
jgi:hypothetical protein